VSVRAWLFNWRKGNRVIDAEHIALFFGTAAAVWAMGFGWGKTVAWVRHLRTAA